MKIAQIETLHADGYLTIPRGPGCGTEVNEAAVRAHPARAGG
jgi:L-alanine-DL-glutamate epimerase-like enolase superfamily enzyme